MGYDMSIEAPMPEAEQIARDAANDQCKAAVEERGKFDRNTPEWDAAQEKVMAAYDALSPLDTHYFRLNIWGMGRCRTAMYEAGMIYNSHTETPWPVYSPPTSAEGGAEALRQAEQDYDDAHQKACEPIRAEHPEGGDTIPDHKFGSNDGWHVTEEECAAAVKAWRAYDAARTKALPAPDAMPPLEQDGTEADDESPAGTFNAVWWPEWIAFLDRASRRGGFKVY